MMGNKNRIAKNKVAKIIFFISVLFFVISLIIYYYGFEIATFGWHFLHPKESKWNGLTISVPEGLIGKYKDNKFLIYKMRAPREVTIIFSIPKVNYDPQNYNKINFKVTEEKRINILDREGIRIKAVSEKDRFEYMESIYLWSLPISITFWGKEHNKNIFTEVVDKLQWDKSYKQKH